MSYSAGDADAAITMYNRALDDFDQFQGLKNIILSGLGHAHLLKNEYPQSIRFFEMISTSQEKTLRNDALLTWRGFMTRLVKKNAVLHNTSRYWLIFPTRCMGI